MYIFQAIFHVIEYIAVASIFLPLGFLALGIALGVIYNLIVITSNLIRR